MGSPDLQQVLLDFLPYGLLHGLCVLPQSAPGANWAWGEGFRTTNTGKTEYPKSLCYQKHQTVNCIPTRFQVGRSLKIKMPEARSEGRIADTFCPKGQADKIHRFSSYAT